MNPAETFEVGIAPQHVPALLAALLLPVLVLIVRRLRRTGTGVQPGLGPTVYIAQTAQTAQAAHVAQVGAVRRWSGWLLGISAAVHLALPLGHYDGPLLAIAFIASGAAYAWLAMRAIEGRSWRLPSALLVIATLIAYLAVAGSGKEEPDQVGIATALVELAALGLALVPVRERRLARRFTRFLGSAGTVFATFLVGTIVWVGSFAAHAATGTDASTPDSAVGAMQNSGPVVHSGDHTHQHDHAARAQAGVIMRPVADHHPTFAQQQAADQLAAATREATQRYATLDAAIAAGFVVPKPGAGTDVHMENKAFRSDGRTLDPQRPETLVYAIEGGRATLLGVVYVMERAGVAAPEPGGPITRWHAHNICLTALPPGFGIVSPFGSCPALSVNVTTPEMMHVWVVDNPSGWFAEGLDKAWVRTYNAQHGQPYATR